MEISKALDDFDQWSLGIASANRASEAKDD
jgi:hypothetical protein